MNLRSGEIKEQTLKPKKGSKGKRATNKLEAEMATENSESELSALKVFLSNMKVDMDKQFGELKAGFAGFSDEMKQLRGDVAEVRSELQDTTGQLQGAKQRISDIEDREKFKNKALKHLLCESKILTDRVEYLEQKSRQNNLRISQVKEGVEGDDMVAFVNKLLLDKLNIPADEATIVAAHRSLQKRPTESDATPRSIVVRFMQWNSRQKVIRAAWAKKEITLDGSRIYFDRDYSTRVQQERSRYAPIRKALKEKEIKSHIVHPAKLKVFLGGEGDPIIYDTPEIAAKLLAEQGTVSVTLPTSARIDAGKKRTRPTAELSTEELARIMEILEEWS